MVKHFKTAHWFRCKRLKPFLKIGGYAIEELLEGRHRVGAFVCESKLLFVIFATHQLAILLTVSVTESLVVCSTFLQFL